MYALNISGIQKKGGEKMTANRSDLQNRIRTWADRVLTDRLMAELAFLLIPAIVIPLVFSLSTVSILIFDVASKAIVGVFVLEYVLKLIGAESRLKFVINPWRILDLLIILLAGIDFIPSLPIKGWRGSPILRLLRLARVFVATGRTIKGVASQKTDAIPKATDSPLKYRIYSEKENISEASREEVNRGMAEHRKIWIDVQGIASNQIVAISEIFDIPENILESKMFRNSFPSIDNFKEYSIITLWNNRCSDMSHLISKDEGKSPRVLIIWTNTYIATLSDSPHEFVEHFVSQGIPSLQESFSRRALYSILEMRIKEDKSILQVLEQEVAELEENSSQLKPPKFLEKTFQLKKPLQQEGYNLRRFLQMMKNIHESKTMLAEISDESRSQFRVLLNEAEALNDYCQNIQEDMKSLIELQINKVSFDLNRVMRFLAVISCLALIPTIIGGLLGQNLIGQPFKISIGEIFFFVFFSMLIGLYIFFRKGWLK
jgi:Mg2+ and Co2+ transporter CorA